MYDIQLARGIRTLLEVNLNMQPYEDVLIVTDTNNQSIAEAIAFAAAERGADVTISTMLPRRWHGVEPPPSVAASLAVAKIALLPTTFSLTHTIAVRTAREAGARILSLPGCNREIFCDGSLEVDFVKLQSLVETIGQKLSTAKQARILSANNAILTIPLAGRASVDLTGVCHAPGSLGVPPNVETAVSPLEGGVFGTLVVDGAIVPGGVVADPFAVHFQDGRIVAIEGGSDADRFGTYLDDYTDPNMFCPVELGFGLNPNATMGKGFPLEAEGEFGSVHIGLGEGRSFGSSIRAKAHVDLVVRAPVAELDGEVLLQNKEFTLNGRKFKIGEGGEIEGL